MVHFDRPPATTPSFPTIDYGQKVNRGEIEDPEVQDVLFRADGCGSVDELTGIWRLAISGLAKTCRAPLVAGGCERADGAGGNLLCWVCVRVIANGWRVPRFTGRKVEPEPAVGHGLYELMDMVSPMNFRRRA